MMSFKNDLFTGSSFCLSLALTLSNNDNQSENEQNRVKWKVLAFKDCQMLSSYEGNKKKVILYPYTLWAPWGAPLSSHGLGSF